LNLKVDLDRRITEFLFQLVDRLLNLAQVLAFEFYHCAAVRTGVAVVRVDFFRLYGKALVTYRAWYLHFHIGSSLWRCGERPRRVLLVLRPARRIIHYILADKVKGSVVADDVFIIIALP